MSDLSRAKITQAQAEFARLVDRELEVKVAMSKLYAQLCLDATEEDVLRQIRQIFFRLHKKRFRSLIRERYKFSPFFLGEPKPDEDGEGYLRFNDDSDDEDDDNGLV